MKIIKEPIEKKELDELADHFFGILVKAVVDIQKEIMVIDAELHADQEKLLLETGSEQKNLWGINLYPDKPEDTWVEFDSMINIRPWAKNRSRGVDDPVIREKILSIVYKLVKR
jgi:hypothetical protein